MVAHSSELKELTWAFFQNMASVLISLLNLFHYFFLN